MHSDGYLIAVYACSGWVSDTCIWLFWIHFLFPQFLHESVALRRNAVSAPPLEKYNSFPSMHMIKKRKRNTSQVKRKDRSVSSLWTGGVCQRFLLTEGLVLPRHVGWLVLRAYCCSITKSCLTLYDPWTAARQASLSFAISQSWLKLTSIESVMPSNHLILCRPLLLLPSIFPSIRVFSNESALHIRWPQYWSFNFSISPSKSIQGWFSLGWTGLISLQSKGLSRVFSNSLKVSILVLSQLSYLYMTTGKNHSFD